MFLAGTLPLSRGLSPKVAVNSVKNAPRVLLPHSEAENRKLKIFNFVILLSSSSSRVTQKP